MTELAPALFLAVPFVLFGLLTLSRKRRLSDLAASLGARQEDVGWFSLGRIVGERFEIAPTKVGKSYRTEVQLDSEGAPGKFLLLPRFFESFPDWDFARVPAQRTERAFLWHVTLPGHAQPSTEQRQALLGWLSRTLDAASVHSALEKDRIGEIWVADGSVSVSLRGLVLDRSRLRRTLDVLGELTGRRSA